MSNTDYTQLFEKIQMTKGQIPEFPFDLLDPTLIKQMKDKAKALMYAHPSHASTALNKQGPVFCYGGDSILVSTFEVTAGGPQGSTRKDVEDMIKAKINEYCKEMIQFEQKHSFPSNKENRIIVSMHGIRIYDYNTNPGAYYGWDEVGFLILRK